MMVFIPHAPTRNISLVSYARMKCTRVEYRIVFIDIKGAREGLHLFLVCFPNRNASFFKARCMRYVTYIQRKLWDFEHCNEVKWRVYTIELAILHVLKGTHQCARQFEPDCSNQSLPLRTSPSRQTSTGTSRTNTSYAPPSYVYF